MLRRTLRLVANVITVSVLLLSDLHPAPASAQCSEQDHVAVFILDGLDPGFVSLQTELLAVTPVGPVTYPPEEDVYRNIMAVLGDQANPSLAPAQLVGNMWSWIGLQSSSQSLVDRRDGAVLFAGSVIWAGQGQMLCPTGSTHEWEIPGGEPAPAPATTAVLDNDSWIGPGVPTVDELTALAVEHLRTTDVLHSFGACGPYVVTGWIYTPAVGVVDPGAARLVIAVEGKVGPPWNGESVPVAARSWGALQSSFR